MPPCGNAILSLPIQQRHAQVHFNVLSILREDRDFPIHNPASPRSDLRPVRVLVCLLDFLRRKLARQGDRSVEIIRVRGAKTGNLTTRLRPTGGVGGMSMNHAADGAKFLLEQQVTGSI